MKRRTFLSSTVLGALALTVDVPTHAAPGKKKGAEFSVINAGVGGNNTVDMLNRIDKDCLSHQPDLTILMVGTNDMNSMKYIALDQYRQNLSTIIEKIKGVKSKILLMTICPFIEEYLFTRHKKEHYGEEGPAGRRMAVNNTIRELAEKYKLSFLDLGGLFDKVGKVGLHKDSLIQNVANINKTDGVHPTPNGYRFIGLAVYDHIRYNKLPQQRIVCFGDSITAGMGADSYPSFLKTLLA